MISVFELFKIGIGPSSSHTVGPMVAANRFLADLGDRLTQVDEVTIELYGSLSSTGKGHATDTAILLGLLGHEPRSIDTTATDEYLQPIYQQQKLTLGGRHEVFFDGDQHLLWDDQPLPQHPNGMRLTAKLSDGSTISRTYFSIGGGFIKDSDELEASENHDEKQSFIYDFNSASN